MASGAQPRGARASLGAAEANLADAQVSLTSEVAQAYVNVCDCKRRMVLNAQSIERQQQELELTEEWLADMVAIVKHFK